MEPDTRLVFITGASSGIGQALAARYVAAGWRVALVARRVDDMRHWAEAQGWPATQWAVYEADVRDEAAVAEAARACLAAQGLPDVVVANAGISVGVDLRAIRGMPGHAGYCAAKAAVVQMCETLRGELRGHGIRVVTLAPGYIDTPMTRANTYPMPFLMKVDDFADQAFRAIERGVRWRVIPWQMGLVTTILRWMPRWLFDAIAGSQQHRKKQRRT
ncbi:MAG: SDR family NAD(P)-dependent oxidoreductase [Aquabacterium sp.]|nr:SDR family NAD(P)-dependent oxidoreductase [Aquabacterium sp.]